MKWLNDAWETFLEFLAKIGGAILSFVSPLAHAIAVNGGIVLAQAAEEAVLAAETAGGDSSTKLAAARAAVISTLESKGIPVVLNAINGAIEAAVAKLKANQATSQSASDPPAEPTQAVS